jgi:hypothetical protein
MRPFRSATGWLFALASLLALGGAALLGMGLSAERAGASSADALVARSVCEAHELEARKAEDPSLNIEIPPEFASPWPTRAACLSYQAASNPDTPGLVQPIPFSHKHHAGLYQIDCLYCHSGTDRSRAAGVPSVAMCMGCHGQFPPTYDTEFEGIRNLKGYWERQESIPWNQIYRLPEYVKFRHNRHIQAGVACQTCHGPVQEMDKVVLNDSTHWWPWLLPTKEPEMGWCINCHRQNKATQDCYACHY